MSKSPFNDDWQVRPKISGFVDLLGGGAWTTVALPHDAMITLERSPDAVGGAPTAFFPGGQVEYRKRFHAPAEWTRNRVAIEFEGVYRDAMVYLNDEFLGQWRYGYSVFRLPLDASLHYGKENVLRVEARAHQDSRWYTGLGIYRDVSLIVAPLAHVADDEFQVATPDVDDELAIVETAALVRNADLVTRKLLLQIEISDENGLVIARDVGPVTAKPGAEFTVRNRLYVERPRRWSVEHPYLYRVVATLSDEEGATSPSVVTAPLGIRTLRVDPKRGLRINDESVILRGACIHHDNGPLGAATFHRAEERRIEILKAAGFNAIRSSHYPVSPAMLDACDRLGMLVFDETFDAWTEMNKPFDYTLDFSEWWERDVDAMVRKDMNHPSVILYSIGNEIHEYGSGHGAAIGRQIAERIRSRDETRFVTTAVSSFWAVANEVIGELRERLDTAVARGVNDVMNEMGDFFTEVSDSEMVAQRTSESHGVADIMGLNYSESRYGPDGERYPNRIMLGTETNPRATAESWRRTLEHPHVIGGFTWTGWDYLGEVGLGRTDYTDDPMQRGGGDPAFPWLTAWSGDIDITGYRRPQSYYREIVFGLRHEPYLAVRRPEHHGRRRVEMQWAWADALSSWTWLVETGSPVEVEVYSDAEQVELHLNGSLIGRRPAGAQHDYCARFDLAYEPGELLAIAYTAGQEVSRSTLRTAGPSTVTVTADRSSLVVGAGDLAYLEIEFRDESGVLDSSRERLVVVEVSGAGVLQALGSANPMTEERFDAVERTTFGGRVLAIVRPTGPGEIIVTVRTEGQSDVSANLAASDVDGLRP